MESLKLILVDDNIPFRNALRTILVDQFNAVIIGEASNANEVYQMNILQKADIILMDVMMPGKNGIELTKNLLWHFRQLKIIAITMHVEKIYLITLIEAGFKGCISKNEIMNQLESALNAVTNDKYYFPSELMIDRENQTEN